MSSTLIRCSVKVLSALGAISMCGSHEESKQAAADGKQQQSSNRGLNYAQTAQYLGAPGTLRWVKVFIAKMSALANTLKRHFISIHANSLSLMRSEFWNGPSRYTDDTPRNSFSVSGLLTKKQGMRRIMEQPNYLQELHSAMGHSELFMCSFAEAEPEYTAQAGESGKEKSSLWYTSHSQRVRVTSSLFCWFGWFGAVCLLPEHLSLVSDM